MKRILAFTLTVILALSVLAPAAVFASAPTLPTTVCAEEGDKGYYTAEDYLADKSLFVPAWYTGDNPEELWEQAEARWPSIYARAHATSDFDKNVLAIGHRGDRWERYYPENSLESYMSIMLYGVDVIEVDVHKTKDNVLVIMHDDTLNNCTNVADYRKAHPGEVPESNYIYDWTYEQLMKLRLKYRSARSPFKGKVSDYVIPTLADVFAIAKGHIYITLDKLVASGAHAVIWDDCKAVADTIPGAMPHIFFPWNLARPTDNVGSILSAGSTCMFRVVKTDSVGYILDSAKILRDCGIAAVARPNGDALEDTVSWPGMLSAVRGQLHIYGELLGDGTLGLDTPYGAHHYWQGMIDQGYTFLMTENIYELVDFVKAHNAAPDPTEGDYRIRLADMELQPAGMDVGQAKANNRDTITSSISAAGGILGSQAWNLHITDIGAANDQTNWLSVNDATVLFTYSHKLATEDVLWLWVNNTSAYDKALMMAFDSANANALFCGNEIYTIVPEKGSPVIQTVAVGETASNGIGLAKHGSNAARRLVLSAGCAGWLGIPVKEIAKEQDGTDKGWLPGTKLSSFELYLRNPWANASISDKDAVSDFYFDEVWVTSSKKLMPDLSDEALLYKQFERKCLLDFEAFCGDLFEAGLVTNDYGSTDVGAEALAGSGYNGSVALAYHYNRYDTGTYWSNSIVLNLDKFAAGVTDWTDAGMLWFWVDTHEVGMSIGLDVWFNGSKPALGTPVYSYDGTDILPIDPMFDPWDGTGRLRLPSNYVGFIGFPLSAYSDLDQSEVKTLYLYMESNEIFGGKTPLTLYLDEFWLAKVNEAPDPSKLCGHTNTEVLPAKDATCTESGLTEGLKCLDCGELLITQETIEALGHDYAADEENSKAPTCLDGGVNAVKCSRCGDTQAEPVDALGHDFENSFCNRCGEVDPDAKDPCEGYTDINRSAWYHTAVDYVISRGYMGSTKTDALTFEPNTKVSRAMVASLLYRICGSPEVTYSGAFSDVPDGMWYSDAVEFAKQNKLASGVGDGKFAPNANVTRQELAGFLMNLAGYLGKDITVKADISGFADAAKVPGWARGYMEWAVGAGLISGREVDGVVYLAAADNAVRSELASMIRGFLTK